MTGIMEVFRWIVNNLLSILGIIGALAFLVSVITEVTKNLGFLKRIPTDLQVIVVSILLCLMVYVSYLSYFLVAFKWYYVFGCVITAFIVAFVSMYGWEKLTTLYQRFKK